MSDRTENGDLLTGMVLDILREETSGRGLPWIVEQFYARATTPIFRPRVFLPTPPADLLGDYGIALDAMRLEQVVQRAVEKGLLTMEEGSGGTPEFRLSEAGLRYLAEEESPSEFRPLLRAVAICRALEGRGGQLAEAEVREAARAREWLPVEMPEEEYLAALDEACAQEWIEPAPGGWRLTGKGRSEGVNYLSPRS